MFNMNDMQSIADGYVSSILLNNGFVADLGYSYMNDSCVVEVGLDSYTVRHNGYEYITRDHVIYTLIGYLVYNRLVIDIVI